MTSKININQIKGCLAGAALAGSMNTGDLTDDTQMSLFTAEGLILSKVRSEYRAENKTTEAIFHSLLRWLYTQQVHMLGDMVKQYGSCSIVDGILLGHKELFALRDPSGTCLKVLSSGKMGSLEYLPNRSTGPGAIVRNIPIGLAAKNSETAFKLSCECAAITHGHPQAILSAGFLSALVCEILNGNNLETALENTIQLLKNHDDHEMVLEAVYQAKNLSMRMQPQRLIMGEFYPSRSALNALGQGLFFTLAFGSDFKKGLRAAIDQSNLTESCEIAGAILGAIHGFDAIPTYDLSNLELGDLILELSQDLYVHYHQTE